MFTGGPVGDANGACEVCVTSVQMDLQIERVYIEWQGTKLFAQPHWNQRRRNG